jgi:hypothetical protein
MKARHRTAAHRLPRLAPRTPAQRMRHLLGVAVALSLLVVSTAVWADPVAVLPSASAEVAAERGPGAATAPRASVEVATRAPAGPWNDGSWQLRYVRWASAGGGNLGVSLGVGAAAPPGAVDPYAPYAPARAHGAGPLVPEVGVRWRSGWQDNRRVDLCAFRGYDTSPAALDERRSYNARVELQFREASSKLGFDARGALGLQLSGSTKLMLRAKHGGPMVYYRSTW